MNEIIVKPWWIIPGSNEAMLLQYEIEKARKTIDNIKNMEREKYKNIKVSLNRPKRLKKEIG